MSDNQTAENARIARALHDHGLCVEVPGREGAHAEGVAACHRFAAAVVRVTPTGQTPTARSEAER